MDECLQGEKMKLDVSKAMSVIEGVNEAGEGKTTLIAWDGGSAECNGAKRTAYLYVNGMNERSAKFEIKEVHIEVRRYAEMVVESEGIVLGLRIW